LNLMSVAYCQTLSLIGGLVPTGLPSLGVDRDSVGDGQCNDSAHFGDIL